MWDHHVLWICWEIWCNCGQLCVDHSCFDMKHLPQPNHKFCPEEWGAGAMLGAIRMLIRIFPQIAALAKAMGIHPQGLGWGKVGWRSLQDPLKI